PEGRYVALTTADGQPGIWDTTTGTHVHTFHPHRTRPAESHLMNNGTYFFSTDISGDLRGQDIPIGYCSAGANNKPRP
ncbi:MAG: hypothetical protein H7Z17_07010, partial [Fuerstia sp.]|nr:hypothetical protein [Fuerstiella sp.]